MRRPGIQFSRLAKASAIVLIFGPLASTQAAILRTRAALNVSVQEIISGEPGSTSGDSASYDPPAGTLPILASANLVSTDLNGIVQALGQSISAFADPARLDQPNPEELALEAACYSNSTDFGYTVSATASEDRTLIFTSPGSAVAPSEIQFEPDGTRTIQSTIFINGAALIWATDASVNLEELGLALHVLLSQDGQDASLVDEQLIANGGSTAVTADHIVFQEVTVDELTNLGVSIADLALLRALDAQGFLRIIVLPPQEHTYTYHVTADQALTLTANFSLSLHAVPGGTGVAVTIGRPFQELSDFINQAIPGIDGQSVQSSLNKLVDSRDVIQVPAPTGSTTQSPFRSMCGALGMEVFMFAGLFLASCLRRS